MPEPREKDAFLRLSATLQTRLKTIAQRKGYLEWTEYARSILIEACEEEAAKESPQ